MTTVLMVEDHALLLECLCSLLKTDDHIKVVGKARNGREAVMMARALEPDVIVMDIAMPVLNGLEATRQILAFNPEAKVIIISDHRDYEYVECMTTVGAVGCLEKQKLGECLTHAIHEVVQGYRFFSPTFDKHIAGRQHDGWLKPNGVRRTPRETK